MSRRGAAADDGEGGGQSDLGLQSRRAGGRKDREGTEETIRIQPIKEGAAEVMKLMRRAEDAKTKVNEAFEALAKRSGTTVANLKKLFKSSLKGTFAEARRDVDQQQVLFEQVGEIPGGGTGASPE